MADDIAFQNGFICGLATKGLTYNKILYSEGYVPICWNDPGDYSCFYINFQQPVKPFSTGMLSESIIVHDATQLNITGQIKVTDSLYKLSVDLSNRPFGITVINKATSVLCFDTGERLPPFSVHFYVSGIVSYNRLPYMFDYTTYTNPPFYISEIDPTINLPDTSMCGPFSENAAWNDPTQAMTTSESCSIVLV